LDKNASKRSESMPISEMDVIDRLDKDDKEKIVYFINLLIRQTKYRTLREEIEKRREEIKAGDVLTHEEIWNKVNV
jgi:hypothetical protein